MRICFSCVNDCRHTFYFDQISSNYLSFQHFNVYEVLKKQKLAMDLPTFLDLQQRLLNQYTYNARKKTMATMVDDISEGLSYMALKNSTTQKQ